MVDLKKELGSSQVILSILSNEYYNESLIKIMKQLENGKICYVTLNKTSESLIRSFKSNRISTKNIFFIDAVTKSVGPNKALDNSILISSPYALTELGIAISEILKTKAFGIIIFDSLSTLSIYQKDNKNVTAKFTSQIINKIRSNDNKGVFTCLEDDAGSELIKESSMFVDKVVRMSEIKGEVNRKMAKNAAAAVLTVVGLAFAAAFLQPSGDLTGMTFAEQTPSGGIVNPALISILIGGLLAGSIFLMYHLSRSVQEVKIPIRAERKLSNPLKVRKQFKDKIIQWLNASKAFFF